SSAATSEQARTAPSPLGERWCEAQAEHVRNGLDGRHLAITDRYLQEDAFLGLTHEVHVENEVSERVRDSSAADTLDGLHPVRMPTDDDIGACAYEGIGDVPLARLRSVGVLPAPLR